MPGQIESEYTENILPNPEHGPLEADPIYEENYFLEFFTEKKVQIYHKKFREKILGKIEEKEFDLIESGLAAFTKSSTKLNPSLTILIKSILAWRPEILTEKYKRFDQEDMQMIGDHYFDSYAKILKEPTTQLISPKTLETYQRTANSFCLRAIGEWKKYSIKNMAEMQTRNNYSVMIFRGLNNSSYHKTRQKGPDLLSAYTSVDRASNVPYFEKRLLTSYTLHPVLADHFMVGTISNPSTRRVQVRGSDDIIKGRVFSSFLNSPAFSINQYEVLCLPDLGSLKIGEDYNNEISAQFTIYK